MALDPYGSIDGCVFREGFYESEVLEALRQRVAPGEVVWDIGANFGLHAVTLKVLLPETHVVAFEPLPFLAGRIVENARLNNVSISVITCALSDETGITPLYLTQHVDSGLASIAPWDATRFRSTTPVMVMRADRIMGQANLAAPQHLKLDVEGAELKALKGFGEYLQSPTLRSIVFEAEPDVLSTRSTHGVVSLLRESGFSLHLLKRAELTQHKLENFLAERSA